MLIGIETFRKFAPNAIDPERTALALSDHGTRVGITTNRRIRHWLAHLYVESQGFARLEENLNYSALRLTQVWPSRFKTTAAATPYARNARALANKVYGGRMGNTGPNDGWLYRGGGWIMLTGKDNHRSASKWTGLDLVTHPEWARTPVVASQIAADFCRVKGVIELWDEDDDEKVVSTMAQHLRVNEEDDLIEGTEAINGGRIGLDHRRDALKRASLYWK
jgi:putative chitinase